MSKAARRKFGSNRKWGTRIWQLVTAITALILGGGTCALAIFYAGKATEEDRRVMRELAVNGFQLAHTISMFLDARAADLAGIAVAVSSSGEPVAVALESAHALMRDETLRAPISAFGIRTDCMEGFERKTKADTHSGYCVVPYYKAGAIWYQPNPTAHLRHITRDGHLAGTENAPTWVALAARYPGTVHISRLDGTWIPKKSTNLATTIPYEPTALYEGVFHLALGMKIGGEGGGRNEHGIIVIVLDLDHAHIAETVRVRFEPNGRVVPAREGAERFTADDWIRAYGTAHYAYLVDDRAWMIAHPRAWHIIGRSGANFPTAAMSKDELGDKPLNLKMYAARNSDDMTAYYRAVVDALVTEKAFYGAGDNMVGHDRLVWAQPVFMPRPLKWVSLDETDDADSSGGLTNASGRLFGVVVVGDDLKTLSPVQGYAYIYLLVGALLIFLLEIGIWRWINALAALDGMLGAAGQTKALSLRDLLPGDRPVQLVRQALERAVAADRHERAKNLLKAVLSQLRAPLTTLDVILQCLRKRDGEPFQPTEELLNEIALTIDQLKLLLREANCVKLNSDEFDMGRHLQELVDREWPNRVEYVGPTVPVICHVPWKVIEQSVAELVSNALHAVNESDGKFVCPLGWKHKVRIELQVHDEGPIIAVMDAGCRVARHIDPFDWGSSAWTRGSPRPGMGLPCTRLRLSMFGGKLTHSVERGYSARFSIHLPSLPRGAPS